MKFKFIHIYHLFNLRFCILFGMGFIVMITSGCKKDIPIDENLLSKYNDLANPTERIKVIEDIDCYLDYSFGMGQGMRATASFNDMLKNFLYGKTVKYYKVGASNSPVLIDINSSGANFLDLNNYNLPVSKLKVGLDQITLNKDRSSIFITDFERVENATFSQNLPGAPKPHPIDASAWAQNNFKEWLNVGNQIDIFAMEYNKPDYWFDRTHQRVYKNFIYTIVFTPRSIIKDEGLYKISVLNYLNNEYQKTNGYDSKHFIYTSDNFIIKHGQMDGAIGSANDNLIVQDLITNTIDKNFEYYEFLSASLLDFNVDESMNDKRIINKIKVTSENPVFTDVKFGINAYDITQSLNDFYNSMTQVAPLVNVNVETGERDTIAKPIQYEYRKEKIVEDIFDFVYNQEKNEIGIKVKPDFTGISQNTIYQVDIIVSSVILKDFEEEDSVLKLNYAQDYCIRSLAESLKLAMNAVSARVEGKVLYTVYIKIDK